MNSPKILYTGYIILIFSVSLIFTGCEIASRSETPLAPYIHYTPSEELNVHLEFDYPSSWIFNEIKRETGTVVIVLKDPRFLTLPTPVDMHPVPNDLGIIDILVSERFPWETPDTKLDLLKQSYSSSEWTTILDDYRIKVDGYDARVLEYLTNEFYISTSTPPPPMIFNRRIVFAFEDQMYTILFSVSETDRRGEFEKGYEYFINSLKIVQ